MAEGKCHALFLTPQLSALVSRSLFAFFCVWLWRFLWRLALVGLRRSAVPPQPEPVAPRRTRGRAPTAQARVATRDRAPTSQIRRYWKVNKTVTSEYHLNQTSGVPSQPLHPCLYELHDHSSSRELWLLSSPPRVSKAG